jgi:hypothetical protein
MRASLRSVALVLSIASACAQTDERPETAADSSEWKRQRPPETRADASVPAPIAAGARFSPRITHPYLPLSTVRTAEFHSKSDKVLFEVQPETRQVAGVECLVLAEKEYEDGELAEISFNYFAQDEEGNVYYFGEDVDDYEDGQVVSHGGAWLVGRNAKEPCLFMPARPRVGFLYKPENSPPAAEEWAEIAAIDAVLEVPAGSYADVLVVKETDHADRWQERKYYARGVGLISENGKLNLTAVR